MRIYYEPVSCMEEGSKRRKKSIYGKVFHDYLNCIIIFVVTAILLTLYHVGVLTYIIEQDFANFDYPKDVGDLRRFVQNIDNFHMINDRENLVKGINKVDYGSISELVKQKDFQPTTTPLEQFRPFNFTLDIQPTCQQQWGLDQIRATLLPDNLESSQKESLKISVIIVVKSAVNNYLRRDSIRNSWYLNRDLDIFKFKTVFIVGKCHEQNRKPYSTKEHQYNISWSVHDCEQKIGQEAKTFGDIIQSSAIDSYYNNTIKTFMTYKWVSENCPSDFILTIDDDYVFEVDNFIKFLRELPQVDIPQFAQPYDSSPEKISISTRMNTNSTNASTISNATSLSSLRRLSNEFLLLGYVRFYAKPFRITFSKWFIKLDEYRYNKYPPYVGGGAVFMSFKTVKYLNYAAYFTNSYKFDDVYQGIMAHKMRIPPIHSEEFMCDIGEYLDSNPIRSNVTKCIGVHDIESTDLIELWERRNQTDRNSNIAN